MLVVIYDRDNTHADPTMEQRGCYKRGDIVAIKHDSAHDGDIVANPISPPWYLVRVTGTIPDNIMDLMRPELDVNRDTVTRRLWRVDLDAIPQAIMDELNANRYYEIALDSIRGNIRNKNNGGSF